MKLTSSVIVALMTCALVVNGWGRSSIAQILPPDGWRGISFCTSQPIMSGNTVSLKCTILNLWLSYSLGQWCRRDDCPERYFSKPNSQSLGKMFQIYILSLARGCHITVRDKEAFYYPAEEKWFGCWQCHCNKYLRPGNPNMNMNLLILTSGNNVVKYLPFMPTVNKRVNRL